jgi:hypothetical protein
MENTKSYIRQLHQEQEASFIDGKQASLDIIGAELDEVLTQELIEEMKGE